MALCGGFAVHTIRSRRRIARRTMSKRKQRAKTRPAPAPPAGPEQPATRPEPASAAVTATGPGMARRLWPLYLVLLIVGLTAAGLWLAQPQPVKPAATPVATAASTAELLPIGSASYCRSNPRFAAAAGLGDVISVSTSERMIKGLVMYDANLQPDQVQLGAPGVYQHPTWDDAGYLGPVAADGAGNIFTAPSPRVSLLDNPPEGANTCLLYTSPSPRD